MNGGKEQEELARRMAACLLSVANAQDRQAFERLFRHFAPRIKAYLKKGGGNPASAEELMQETMVTVWRKAVQFDPSRASASTWVFTIARNLRIDAYRRERHPEIDWNDPALVPDADPEPDTTLEARQSAEAVTNALAALSPSEQAVLRLAYFEDKSQSAIADELAIPLGTVKSRLRLAFGKLRGVLASTPGEGP